MSSTITLDQLFEDHLALDIQCLDRIYLNAYIPTLQCSGQVVTFLTSHRGNPIPSPALFNTIGQAFRRRVTRFAKEHHIPWVPLNSKDRKQDVMAPYLKTLADQGRYGVAAIGVAQEYQRVWNASTRKRPGRSPQFDYSKPQRRVTCYYFYLRDPQFGPAFIKLCAYFPYPAKVWINGHEWVKQQAAAQGLDFTPLSNGFAECADPELLQTLCDSLGPAQIEAFFRHWMDRLPLPLNRQDRQAGYDWELSMRQVEVSRTLVFKAPRQARLFCETLIADNLDLGRPEHVEIIFGRKIRRDTQSPFRTSIKRHAIDTHTTGVVLNLFYKHSRIKQYFKDGRALRIEAVINSPGDLGCQARLHNLDELQQKARACNQRILHAQRVGQGCVLASPAFERMAHPGVDAQGRRTPALRFGDPRVMALTGALCATTLAIDGFTNKRLRALVANLLDQPYSSNQMTYDLRRLRQLGLIQRRPRRNRYDLTEEGLRMAVVYNRLHNRLLRPLMAADQPQSPPPVRQALKTVCRYIDDCAANARFSLPAKT